MGLEKFTSPENNPLTNEQRANKITELREKKLALEEQLNKGDATLAGRELSEQQAAIKNTIAAETLFRISEIQKEISTLERDLAAATYGTPKNLSNTTQDTSYDMFEKQYRSLPLKELSVKKEELSGLLNTLLRNTAENDSTQLLSDTFGNSVENDYKISDLRKKIGIMEKLIAQAERYNVATDPYSEVSKKRGDQ